MRDKYQVMPPLTEAEYEALKADISERGVLVPLEFCIEDGELVLLDGHHRFQICTDLNITDYPKVVRANVGTEDECRAYARQINLLRRHLNTEQRADLIKAQLKESPEYSDRALAGMLGVSDKTVGSYRKELEASAEIPQLDKRRGKDGKARLVEIRKPVTVFNPNEKQIRLLGDDAVVARMAEGKNKSPVVASRRIKQIEKTERKRRDLPLDADDIWIENEDLRNGLAWIVDETLDLVFCDPPYSKEHIDLYGDIAKLAMRTLRTGGSCLVMTGTRHLPQVLQQLTSVEGLNYWWTLSFNTERNAVLLDKMYVQSNWKPIIWLVKGHYKGDIIHDTIKAPEIDGDKDFSEHGQSLKSVEDIIYRFTDSGEWVGDFCMGGGSVGAACVRLGRKFCGADIDEEAFKNARQRIAHELWQREQKKPKP